jgi:hypothetical protein
LPKLLADPVPKAELPNDIPKEEPTAEPAPPFKPPPVEEAWACAKVVPFTLSAVPAAVPDPPPEPELAPKPEAKFLPKEANPNPLPNAVPPRDDVEELVPSAATPPPPTTPEAPNILEASPNDLVDPNPVACLLYSETTSGERVNVNQLIIFQV